MIQFRQIDPEVAEQFENWWAAEGWEAWEVLSSGGGYPIKFFWKLQSEK